MKDFKEKRRIFLFDYHKKTRIAEGIKYFKLLEKKESGSQRIIWWNRKENKRERKRLHKNRWKYKNKISSKNFKMKIFKLQF